MALIKVAVAKTGLRIATMPSRMSPTPSRIDQLLALASALIKIGLRRTLMAGQVQRQNQNPCGKLNAEARINVRPELPWDEDSRNVPTFMRCQNHTSTMSCNGAAKCRAGRDA